MLEGLLRIVSISLVLQMFPNIWKRADVAIVTKGVRLSNSSRIIGLSFWFLCVCYKIGGLYIFVLPITAGLALSVELFIIYMSDFLRQFAAQTAMHADDTAF